jgi:hypothetical protein
VQLLLDRLFNELHNFAKLLLDVGDEIGRPVLEEHHKTEGRDEKEEQPEKFSQQIHRGKSSIAPLAASIGKNGGFYPQNQIKTFLTPP